MVPGHEKPYKQKILFAKHNLSFKREIEVTLTKTKKRKKRWKWGWVRETETIDIDRYKIYFLSVHLSGL